MLTVYETCCQQRIVMVSEDAILLLNQPITSSAGKSAMGTKFLWLIAAVNCSNNIEQKETFCPLVAVTRIPDQTVAKSS